MARLTIEFGFGDIYSRPGLDLKSREIATVAALTALGLRNTSIKSTYKSGFKCRMYARRNQRDYYSNGGICGFPAALNAMFAAKEVFSDKG